MVGLRLFYHSDPALATTLHSANGDVATVQEMLKKLARQTMPFGRYAGRVLIDLPEEYLLWFRRRGFPSGELGLLLALALEIHSNGQRRLLDPLRSPGCTAQFNADDRRD